MRRGVCKACKRTIGVNYLGLCDLCRRGRKPPQLVQLAEERALSDAS